MAKGIVGWALGLGIVVGSLSGCGGTSTQSDSGAESCLMGSQNDADFDNSTLPSDVTACQTDADCRLVELSSDCGNGCVSAVVNQASAAAIEEHLAATPQQRCSACSTLLAKTELTIDESCSATPINPVCVGGQCHLHRPL